MAEIENAEVLSRQAGVASTGVDIALAQPVAQRLVRDPQIAP